VKRGDASSTGEAQHPSPFSQRTIGSEALVPEEYFLRQREKLLERPLELMPE
jgi:hypothetical protein